MGILLSFIRFVIELGFNMISILVLLRFLLQCVKANFYHPIIQFIVKITNPILIPIRRITPVFNSYDWSCIVLVIIIGIIKYCLFMLFKLMTPVPPLILIGFVLIDIVRLLLNIYIFVFILQALASWLGSSPRQSIIVGLLNQLTNPILRRIPFRLQFGMIDFRPMVIILLLFIGLSLASFATQKLDQIDLMKPRVETTFSSDSSY